MLSSFVKPKIERIHISYLINNFNLEYPESLNLKLNRIRPDLAGETGVNVHLFELKSRLYPVNQTGPRKRPESDFAWWSLEETQIKNYENLANANNYGLFWIFMLGRVKERISDKKTVVENCIQHRDIYVAPWKIYKTVALSGASQRNIGLSRLKRELDFTERSVRKGTLFISKSINDLVNNYFKS